MSSSINRKELTLIALCLTVSVVSGCDIMEYFKGKKKETPQAQAPAAVASAPAAAAKSQDPNVLASVGSWSITADEFNKRLTSLKELVPDFDASTIDAKRLVLEEIIRQQLLLEDAQQKGVDKKPEIAEAVEEFKRTVIIQEIAKDLTKDVTITDEELKKFYDENKKMLVSKGQWKVRMIVVEDKAQADKLLVDILNGADFAESAKTYSKDATAATGGDLGYLEDVPFPQMAGALLSLDVGSVSNVFSGPNGFYVIKLEDKKGGEPLEFDAVKEEIRQNQLMFKQQQAILDHILKLEEQHKVQVNENLLK